MEVARTFCLAFLAGFLAFSASASACECSYPGKTCEIVGSGPDAFDPGFINDGAHTNCICFPPGTGLVCTNGPKAAIATCTCKSGYTEFYNSAQQGQCTANGYGFICGQEPAFSALPAASCKCKSGYSEYTDPSGPGMFCSANSIGYMCGQEPDLAAAATSATAKNINLVGSNSPATQADLLDSAADISEKGSSNRATIGAADCADGANAEISAEGTGAGALAACQDNFAKANVLAKMAAKGSLVADPAVLASEDVQKILQKFEKNFGVNKEDYISRMLAAHGSQDELKDMLSSKFTADKFEKMMAGAGEVKPAGDIANESGVSEAATTGASKKIDTSLRDSLKKKLQDSRTLASLKTNPPSEKPFYKLTNLKPNGLDALVNGNQEQETELTLFDIIRLKLREYTVKERL